MTNKQQYVERKKYKKEQIYDAIAKRIREICDLTDSVTSADFAPTSDMSGEVAVYTYASSFLPFYKRCIEAKLYKPIR